MKLKDVGEFGLIDMIKKDAIINHDDVVLGIGDDAAVYIPRAGWFELLTTDMLIENVHFDLTKTTPCQLGYKALAVNLSDIAAMGGRPRHAVVSLGLPPALSVEFVVELYTGMKEICREYAVNIIGGDTVSSPSGLVVNVALTGEVEPTGLLRRSGAKSGDFVVVTGTLGNSAAGLDLLMRGSWEEFDFAWPLVSAHLTPRPQLGIGQKLAKWGATSANDISDGLSSEANELAHASKVGLRIFRDKIPLAPELVEAAAVLGKSPYDYALFGGEDYQLIFTCGPQEFAAISMGEAPLTVVGEVIDGSGVILVDADGRPSALEARGYNHFR